jgi:hypothetical protein
MHDVTYGAGGGGGEAEGGGGSEAGSHRQEEGGQGSKASGEEEVVATRALLLLLQLLLLLLLLLALVLQQLLLLLLLLLLLWSRQWLRQAAVYIVQFRLTLGTTASTVHACPLSLMSLMSPNWPVAVSTLCGRLALHCNHVTAVELVARSTLDASQTDTATSSEDDATR